jgi:hypothetical protein
MEKAKHLIEKLRGDFAVKIGHGNRPFGRGGVGRCGFGGHGWGENLSPGRSICQSAMQQARTKETGPRSYEE